METDKDFLGLGLDDGVPDLPVSSAAKFVKEEKSSEFPLAQSQAKEVQSVPPLPISSVAPTQNFPPDQPAVSIIEETTEAPPPPKKTSFFRKQLLIVAIFILIGAGAVSGATYFFLQKNPQEVIKTMLVNMQEVKSLHYKVDLEIQGNNGSLPTSFKLPQKISPLLALVALVPGISVGANGDNSLKFNIGFEGDLDFFETGKTKFDCDVNFSGNAMGEKINFAAGARYKDDIFYLKLKNIPPLPIPELDQIRNKWLSVDTKEIGKQLEGYGLIQLKEEQKTEGSGTSTELSDSQKEELRKLFKETSVFEIDNKLPDELVGDVKTWHYKVKFNLPEFKKLVVGVSKIVAKDAITMENIEKSFDEAMGNVKNMEGELWIGKKDYLLYKMFADVEVSESKSKSNYSFALSLFFSNYNQAVNIEAPTDTISLADLIQKSLEDARKKAEDAMKVSNVKQLQLAAELYFDAKGYYPKTSDVQVLFKEFEKQKILTFSGQPSETFPESGGFYCSRQNGKSYVLGVTLNDSSASFLNSDLDGKFVCDDKKTVDCADPVYCTGLQ